MAGFEILFEATDQASPIIEKLSKQMLEAAQRSERFAGDIAVASNSMVFESCLRDDTIWAARNEYRLRYVDGELRMAYKKVTLVNNEKALFTLSFLI